MPYFLIAFAWATAVLVGLVALGFQGFRWPGLHLLAASTAGAFGAVAASLAGLAGGALLGRTIGGEEVGGLVALGGLGLGLIGGSAGGALAGSGLVLMLQLNRRRAVVRVRPPPASA